MKLKTRFFLLVILLLGCLFQVSVDGQIPIPPTTTYDFVTTRFKEDVMRHRIYASVASANSVVVIDSTTLNSIATLSVGSSPAGMAISQDNSTLYVALSGEHHIDVIDLASLTVMTPLATNDSFLDIEAGLGNRLYVTSASGNTGLQQLDATTGALQAAINSATGHTQMTSDRTQLFFNTTQPAGTYQHFDVSTSTATLLGSYTATAGDLVISHNDLALTDTENIRPTANFSAILGTFPAEDQGTGPTCFSADDASVFEYNSNANQVRQLSSSAFDETGALDLYLNTGDQSAGNNNSPIINESSGQYLFFGGTDSTSVYDLWANQTVSGFATVGQPFSYRPPIFLSTSHAAATGLPDGLTFDAATRLISGTPTTAGQYSIVISGSDATHSSSVIFNLSIFPNSWPANISTRLDVQTDSGVLISGFIISGNREKEIVVRALGPSLAVAGVPLEGRLENPTMELHDAAGDIIATNDNWATDANSGMLTTLGLAPKNPNEAALYRVLEPGAYTVVISGVDNTTGIALGEVYDVGGASQTDLGGARLANISTRGNVETGDNVMIGGLIIDGTDDAPLLVLALGPSLANNGVSGALADPNLTVYDAQGTSVAYNDNWQDTQETEIQATGLAPTNPLEPAIDIALMPAAYTAIVRGAGTTTGVALLEAYNIPATNPAGSK